MQAALHQFEGSGFVHLLAQKSLDSREHFHRFVDAGVGTCHVAPERDQRFDLHIGGVVLFHRTGGLLMFRTGDLVHAAADRLADINGRIVPRFRQFAG